MSAGYKGQIEAYCKGAGVAIPVGFERHTAGRFAAIDLESDPPRLVATTWPSQEEVAYYLVHFAADRQMKVFDFQDHVELVLDARQTLVRNGHFSPKPD